MAKTHNLKILPEYFEAVKDGRKNFELRMDDRDFKVGDWVYLQEYDWNKYTGQTLCRKIVYILRNCEQYGLKEGYCILGLSS